MRMLRMSNREIQKSLGDRHDPYKNSQLEDMDLSTSRGFLKLRREDRPVLHLRNGKRVFVRGLRFHIVRSSMRKTYLQCLFKEVLFKRSEDGPIWGAELEEFTESALVWFSECFPLTLAGRVVRHQDYWIAHDVWSDYRDRVPDCLEGYVVNNPYWNDLAATARFERGEAEQRMKETRWRLLDAQMSAEEVFKQADALAASKARSLAAGSENPVQKFHRLRSEFLSAAKGAAPGLDYAHPFCNSWFTQMYEAKAEALSIQLESARADAEAYLDRFGLL